MLGWALAFLILALVAGYMGFFGLAGLAAPLAKSLLVVFLILLIVSAFSARSGDGRPFDLKFDRGVRNMRIPNFILERPMEGLIAGVLLLVLLFGSADRQAAEAAKPGPQIASSKKI